jgi:hypothetical protein
MRVVLFPWRMWCFSQEKKVKRLVRLFRRTCAIESVFWKTPSRLFLPSLPNLVQCSSINCIGKENSSDLASSFTRMLPHLRTSLLHGLPTISSLSSLHPYPQAWSREFEFNVFELNLRNLSSIQLKLCAMSFNILIQMELNFHKKSIHFCPIIPWSSLIVCSTMHWAQVKCLRMGCHAYRSLVRNISAGDYCQLHTGYNHWTHLCSQIDHFDRSELIWLCQLLDNSTPLRISHEVKLCQLHHTVIVNVSLILLINWTDQGLLFGSVFDNSTTLASCHKVKSWIIDQNFWPKQPMLLKVKKEHGNICKDLGTLRVVGFSFWEYYYLKTETGSRNLAET